MLSLVTLAGDGRRRTARLLQAAARMRPQPFEVVVVDVGGRPGDCPQDGLPVRFVDGAGLSFAAARNLGTAAASGTLLLFLDSDCLPGRDLAGEVRAALRRRGGLVVATVRDLVSGFEDDGREPWRLTAAAPAQALGATVPCPPELFSGVAFAVRRRVLQRLGGFSERYAGADVADVDLAYLAAAQDVPVSRWSTALTYRHHDDGPFRTEDVHDLVHDARVFWERWGRWPFSPRLADLRDRGLVRWQPEEGVLVASDRVGAP